MVIHSFHISVTDSRATWSRESICLYRIIRNWSVGSYPSHISVKDFLPTVGKAVSEIISIGRERKCESDAQKMCANLREMKEYGEQTILKYCVKLYTQSSFLFRALHQDLGDYYDLDAQKLHNYERLLNPLPPQAVPEEPLIKSPQK